MLKSFKTEINPTKEQIVLINKTIGVCRFIYNFYIAYNQELYKTNHSFMSGREFSVWMNNEYLPNNPEYSWIKEVSSKSVKQSIMNGYEAFSKFFQGKSRFPRFKKKRQDLVKMYFVKTNPTDCYCERHRIKIPTLGWVRLKEKGYIPLTKNGYAIRSGTISKQAGRYYVSVIVEIPDKIVNEYSEGIGIDLGIKDLAIVSTGQSFKNINKSSNVRKLEKRLKREQRRLSRKQIKKKGEVAQNREKQRLKVQKLHQRVSNIRTDYINKTIAEIVKTKPSYITIEDLNVKGMMKNKHLSKAISSQRFYEFRTKLKSKCDEYRIELRIADRFYPSSKTCNCCGRINKTLKLSDRIFKCECGYIADRDFNASLNLKDLKIYTVT